MTEFLLTSPAGEVIARGDAALEALPDTRARAEALEAMLRTEIRALEAQERADAAQEEQQQAERVRDAMREATVRAFCDSIDALGRRLDAFERRRADEEEQAERERIEDALKALPTPPGEARSIHDAGPKDEFGPMPPPAHPTLEL
jgi:hypothetical protein